MIDGIVSGDILNTEYENKIQIINVNSDSVLIFKLKGQIGSNDIVEKIENKLEEKTGCKVFIIGETLELIKVLNKENKQDYAEEENLCPKIELGLHPSG